MYAKNCRKFPPAPPLLCRYGCLVPINRITTSHMHHRNRACAGVTPVCAQALLAARWGVLLRDRQTNRRQPATVFANTSLQTQQREAPPATRTGWDQICHVLPCMHTHFHMHTRGRTGDSRWEVDTGSSKSKCYGSFSLRTQLLSQLGRPSRRAAGSCTSRVTH